MLHSQLFFDPEKNVRRWSSNSSFVFQRFRILKFPPEYDLPVSLVTLIVRRRSPYGPAVRKFSVPPCILTGAPFFDGISVCSTSSPGSPSRCATQPESESRGCLVHTPVHHLALVILRVEIDLTMWIGPHEFSHRSGSRNGMIPIVRRFA